jgi:1-acyl-sn-glycerol-3-phosphate acyltransferase
MSPLERILLGVAIWVALVLIARWVVVPLLRYGPDREPAKVLLWRASQVYCYIMHLVRHRGYEEIRRRVEPGGMVVISNHTCSVDPVLIQCGCAFRIRWLMARDMMIEQLDWLWEMQQIIPVSRDKADSSPVREAIRHIRKGGVIGIFPEARIVKPRGEIRPFQPGVGAIVAKTGAPVLLVWVSGTPDVDTMTRAFFTPSRSRVEYIDLIRFSDTTDAMEITRRLRKRLSQVSGWPLNEEPMPAEEIGEEAPADALLPTDDRVRCTMRA